MGKIPKIFFGGRTVLQELAKTGDWEEDWLVGGW